MSKHETPMTEGFWTTVAHGAFLPEYPLIAQPGPDAQQRWADAVILPDEPMDVPSLRTILTWLADM